MVRIPYAVTDLQYI